MNKSHIVNCIVTPLFYILLIIGGFSFSLNNSLKSVNNELDHLITEKNLIFEKGVESQISLALHMCKTPDIIEYLSDPADEVKFNAALTSFTSFKNSFLGDTVFWVSDKDLKYYHDLKFAQIVDKSNPNDYWYEQTVTCGKDYDFNINYNDAIQKMMLWLNCPVADSKKNIIGMAGTGIPLDSFIATMYQGLSSKVEMYLYNKDLEITGCTDSQLIQKKSCITDVIPTLDAGTVHPDKKLLLKKKNCVICVTPFSNIGWYLVIKRNVTFSDVISCALIPFLLVLLSGFLYVLSIVVVKIIRPVNAIKSTVHEMVSGTADLTLRIPSMEGLTFKILVHLVEEFNSFIRKIQDMISTIIDAEQQLSNSGKEMNDNIKETNQVFTKIGINLQNFGNGIENQTSSVENTINAIDSISSNITNLNDMILQQFESIQKASTVVEEMVRNVNNAGESTEKLPKAFAELENNTNLGVEKQNDINERIIQIKEKSAMLQDANTVISSIAEQTNLLAMNAAIEAAHAGDAGKGFAVVADEIRKLSETSSAQSKTIGEQLHSIEEAITLMVNVSEESMIIFNSVSTQLKQTDILVKNITDVMQVQNSGSKEIGSVLVELNGSSEKVKSASVSMSDSSKSIINQVEILKENTRKLESGINQINEVIGTVEKTGDILSNISNRMNNSIDSMNKKIVNFKV